MYRFELRSGFPLLGLLAAFVVLTGCSEEIRSDGMESTPERQTRLESPEAAEGSDDGFRTHLYSERDADVYCRLQDETGGEAGLPVREIRIEIGDRVEEGQVMAVLENAEAELAVKSARADADEAAHRYERLRKLVEREMVSRETYEEALYAHQRAQAALERAELELARTRIQAPFDGVVSRRYVRVGDVVRQGDRVFRVTQMSPLRARLLVPEERSQDFQEGDRVLLSDTDGGRDTARVVVVAPSIDPASGTREVIVELTNPDGFQPGQTVVARLLE